MGCVYDSAHHRTPRLFCLPMTISEITLSLYNANSAPKQGIIIELPSSWKLLAHPEHQEQGANSCSVISQKTVICGRLCPVCFALTFRNSCPCILCFFIYSVFNDAVSSADCVA